MLISQTQYESCPIVLSGRRFYVYAVIASGGPPSALFYELLGPYHIHHAFFFFCQLDKPPVPHMIVGHHLPRLQSSFKTLLTILASLLAEVLIPHLGGCHLFQEAFYF